MYQAIGVIELKSLAQGVSATDAALKSAGVSLVTAHPSCPGKYEIMLTGTIADVTAAVDHVSERFEESIIDASVMGRIDEQVISALFGSQAGERSGSLGIIDHEAILFRQVLFTHDLQINIAGAHCVIHDLVDQIPPLLFRIFFHIGSVVPEFSKQKRDTEKIPKYHQ